VKSNIKILMAFSVTALSSNGFANEWTKCRAVVEDAERLACYDLLVDTNNAKRVERKNQSSEDVVSVETTAVPVAAKSTKEVELATSNSSPTEKVEKLHTEQTFGMERKIAESEQLDEIHTSFEGEFTGWEAKQEFALANGQVWKIADGSTGYHRISNPKIRIKRGVFGVFFMTIEGLNKSPKVKRVK